MRVTARRHRRIEAVRTQPHANPDGFRVVSGILTALLIMLLVACTVLVLVELL